MFIVRNTIQSDLEDLFDLSKQALLLNLPQDKQVIKRKIEESISSFKSPNQDISKNHFIFCLEDTSTNKVLGVSMIHGKHGTENKPHFYLTVGNEKRSSETLNKNYQHETLKFGFEPNGYTEIGGLVLDRNYRGHPDKLGKLLSLSRFLFIAENKKLFTKQIHSELMPPLTSEGSSLLWEAIGRKFFQMEYWEADQLSQTNKEFILNLFPQETIYTKLLPEAAKASIGKVGPDTLPVKKMLEKIGFKYTNEVDPFDGGPHYRANIDDISVINDSKHIDIVIKEESIKANSISCLTGSSCLEFTATYSQFDKSNNQCFINSSFNNKIILNKEKSRTFLL
jgi:arginine N-succinyltransferase